ncbi:hypothetical protein MKX03_004144, partial [Papaver bracteatum]
FCCNMHDLVHDFTQFLTRDHCYDSYNNEDTFCSKKHRNPIHLSLIYDERDASQGSFLATVRKVDNVRTFQCRGHMDHSFSVDSLPSDVIRNLRNLRVLKLKGMGITHISNQIDKLIHLRYLDLSRNKNLIELPDSLCGLVNLQTLKLKRCKSLIKHPKEVWRMIKLRNLDIRLAGLVYLPGGIRNWKYLQTLSTFIVTAAAEGYLGVITEGEKGDNNNEISVLPCLRSLRALVCPELKSLRFLTKSLLPTNKIHLCNLKEFKIREEEDEDLSILPCIRDLYLHWCPSLISEDDRPYLPISPNLTSLEILEGPERLEQSLVNPRDIARFKEIQRLTLYANLDESFMFIPEYVQSLTKLKYLWIGNTSGMHDGGDWSILSHIPNININGKKINPSTYSASSSSSQI